MCYWEQQGFSKWDVRFCKVGLWGGFDPAASAEHAHRTCNQGSKMATNRIFRARSHAQAECNCHNYNQGSNDRSENSKDELQAAGSWTGLIFVGSFGILSFLVIKAVAEIVAIVLSRGDHLALAKREAHEALAEPVQTVEPRIGTDLNADTKLLQLLLARFQQDDHGRARLDGLLKEFCQAGAGVAQHPQQVAAKEDALETTIGKSAW